jgi:hypothetical protein
MSKQKMKKFASGTVLVSERFFSGLRCSQCLSVPPKFPQSGFGDDAGKPERKSRPDARHTHETKRARSRLIDNPSPVPPFPLVFVRLS